MRVHRQSATRYTHDEKNDVLIAVPRARHVAYELGAPCPRCQQGLCFPDTPLVVHHERAEAAFG